MEPLTGEAADATPASAHAATTTGATLHAMRLVIRLSMQTALKNDLKLP